MENFGEVACGVADLSEALGARREAREVRVDPGDAHVEREATVSGPPAAVWDYFFDPEKRLLWDVTLKRVDLRRDSRGREGPGAAMHCAHDSFTVIGTTLDWKPFRYFTQRYEFDGRGVFPSPLLVTIETEALPDGRTRLRQLLQVTSRNPLHHVMIKLLRRSFERQCAEGFERLDAVMSGREAGAGRIRVPSRADRAVLDFQRPGDGQVVRSISASRGNQSNSLAGSGGVCSRPTRPAAMSALA